MAYISLYRKYRPKNFDEIAGQKVIIKTLKNAIKNDRIAHAYLFCGPRGTGKTSTAKIFARAINCEKDSTGCNECENCTLALENNHPDIIEIDAASNNGVEEVRELIEKVKYAPLKGKYKIYIIDEVHMMTKNAYNALLKTIEEPPQHVIFIFATTEPNKVLPTILSRCQRFDFTKVSKEDMKEALMKVCDAENIKIEENALAQIINLADGGMRDALSILDQCYAYEPDKITLKGVYEVYGVAGIDDQIKLLTGIVNKNHEQVISQLNIFDNNGIDFKRLTNTLIELLKTKIINNTVGNDYELIDDDQNKYLNTLITDSAALNMIDILVDCYEKMQFTNSLNSYLEIACLKMMNVSRETFNENSITSTTEEAIAPITDKINSKENIKINEETKMINKKSQKDSNKVEMKEDIKDVSRETSLDDEIIIDDEMILGLLAGANKPEKLNDNELFKSNDKYLMDFEYAKAANLMRNSKILGSSDTYLVLMVDDDLIAKQLNTLDKNDELLSYTKILLGKYKRVFAINKQREEGLVKKFREGMLHNDLPETPKIEIKNSEINETNNKYQAFEDLFNGEIEIKE